MTGRVALYAALWISFGFGHTWLATPRLRAAMGRRFGAGERLAYNVVAALHLLIVLAGGVMLLGGLPAFGIPMAVRVGLGGIGVAGVVILLLGIRSYDLGRFAGTTQIRLGIRDELTETPEPLVTTGLNRFVRHPLYLGLLLMLWGWAITPLALTTAVCASIYIAIGIRFEERKLLRLYGEDYAHYCSRVSALLPWPWRHA